MDHRTFIDFLHTVERLKCNTRHSWTSSGRRESVAEHSWRLAVMALLCADEYPDLDHAKLVKMCLIHDWGEALTGDIPSFYKTEADEVREAKAIEQLLSPLPDAMREEFSALFAETEQDYGELFSTDKAVSERAKESLGVTELNIEDVYPNPHQPRKNFDGEELRSLSQSIKKYGRIQPISVKKLEPLPHHFPSPTRVAVFVFSSIK